MIKDEVIELAKECGLSIIECDNGGLIVEGRDSDPQGLLNLCNAIVDVQREKDAKICDDLVDGEGYYVWSFADAIRANKG